MKKTGIELIAEERQEQIDKHERTVLIDFIDNKDHQLTQAVSVFNFSTPSQYNR